MKNADYWKGRAEQLEQASLDKGAAYYAELDKQFKASQMEIQGKLNAWYGRLANNNGNITLQEAKQLLNKNELEEFHWNVVQYIKHGKENAISHEWEKQLENASAKAHITKLESIQYDMQQQAEVLFGNMNDGLDETLRGVYEDGYYHTAFELQKGLGVGTSFARLDSGRIDKAVSQSWTYDGRNFSDRIWTNKQKLVSELNTTLTQSIIRGEEPQKAIDAIARRLNVSKSAAGTLIMTESAYQASACQHDCFNELGVEKYIIVASLDEAACSECQDMDGKIFDMKDYEVGVTAPPYHPSCRCVTAPYFDDNYGQPSERIARGEDGKEYNVPADMKYKEWKEKYVDNKPENAIIKLAKTNHIRGNVNYKPKEIDASTLSFDSKHINKERGHNITKDQAIGYIDKAILSITRYNGKYECYFSSDGATYVNVKEKSIRTAFNRSQFDDNTENFMNGVDEIE